MLLLAASGEARAQGGPFEDYEPKALVNWMAIGAVGPTEATVRVDLRGDARVVRVVASRNADLRDPILSAPEASDDDTNDGLTTLRLSNLSPNTRYHLAIVADNKIDTARRGRLRTFPSGPSSFTVVASADISPSGVDNAVFGAIRDMDPALFLTVGDLIDRTLIKGSREEAREHWRIMRRSATFGALLAAVPWAHIWDDHDYGINNGDRKFDHRWAARLSYQETVPHYPLALKERSSDVAIAQAFSVGRVRFLLTDLRSERDPNDRQDNENKSMLGIEQREWFEQELRAAAPQHGLVVWASSVPWVADEIDEADHWGGFTNERARIAALIREIGVPVVVVSGDAHTVAIDDGRNADFAPGGGAPVPAIQTGALAAVGKAKAGLGPFSHGRQANRENAKDESIGDGQFVTMDVTDYGGSRLCLQVDGWRVEGDTGRLVALRSQGTGYEGPLLRWGRCWDAAPVAGVRERRIYLPAALLR